MGLSKHIWDDDGCCLLLILWYFSHILCLDIVLQTIMILMFRARRISRLGCHNYL